MEIAAARAERVSDEQQREAADARDADPTRTSSVSCGVWIV